MRDAGRAMGFPPLSSLSLASPGSVNPGEARVGGWSALGTRGHAGSAGRTDGATARSPSAPAAHRSEAHFISKYWCL